MTTLRNITIALCAVFMLASCGGGTPESVAENFQKALMSGDYKEAAKYATEKTAPLLDQLASMTSEEMIKEMKEQSKGAKFNVIAKEINEDEATITLEMVTADGDTNTTDYDLVKENGSWKVDFKK